MITPEEVAQREEYYYNSYRHLTLIHGKSPTHEEMIMYMALILKEDPIELSIALLKIRQQETIDTRFNDTEMPF